MQSGPMMVPHPQYMYSPHPYVYPTQYVCDQYGNPIPPQPMMQFYQQPQQQMMAPAIQQQQQQQQQRPNNRKSRDHPPHQGNKPRQHVPVGGAAETISSAQESISANAISIDGDEIKSSVAASSGSVTDAGDSPTIPDKTENVTLPTRMTPLAAGNVEFDFMQQESSSIAPSSASNTAQENAVSFAASEDQPSMEEPQAIESTTTASPLEAVAIESESIAEEVTREKGVAVDANSVVTDKPSEPQDGSLVHEEPIGGDPGVTGIPSSASAASEDTWEQSDAVLKLSIDKPFVRVTTSFEDDGAVRSAPATFETVSSMNSFASYDSVDNFRCVGSYYF